MRRHFFTKSIALVTLLFYLVSGTNAQTAPGSGTLGCTTYDWQSNGGARTWTHVWPDGKVSFAYTTSSQNYFSDRGTAIATYNANTGQWIASEGRVENEKTGFGSIAQYGSNGIVVAAHTNTQCRIYIIPNKDNIPNNSVEAASTLDNTYGPMWPSVMTSGSNRNIIHVIANATYGTPSGMENVDQPMLYFRSTDGGATWDKENMILPFMGPSYCRDWNANHCYWMETTDDNCLALVVNNPWSDGMVIYSYDNGETWQRKVFYHHPNPLGNLDYTCFYPRWTSCQWDSQHRLHVLYEYNATYGDVGSGSFYPSLGGVAYWNEAMPYFRDGNTTSAISGNLIPGQPFVMEHAYLENDIHNSWWGNSSPSHEMWPEYVGYLPPLTDDGYPEDPYQNTGFNIQDYSMHGNYNQGICGFPVLCMVPGTNEMVAVWSAMDENHTDSNGNYYYKIFASYSNTKGREWSPMVHLTNYSAYNNTEFIYNQAAVVGRKLVVVAQADGQTGAYVQSNESDPSDNCYRGFVFNIDNLFDTTPVVEYTITTSADPAEGGKITATSVYTAGHTCTLNARPYNDYDFVSWTKNGVVVSTDPSFSFVVNGNASYVAHFTSFDGIAVGDGNSTHHFLPTNSFYKHSMSQQIYTHEDLGEAATITSLALYNDGESKTRNLNIYMVNTETTHFNGSNDWIAVNAGNLVFSGNVAMLAQRWNTIVLNNPFVYDGTNLALIIDDNTGSSSDTQALGCRVFSTNDIQATFVYSNSTNFDPYNPSQYYGGNVYYENVKNQIRLTVEPPTIATPTVNPDPIDMGYRPNDAWMRPFSFSLYNPGAYTVINNVTVTNPYFTLETDGLSFPLPLGTHASQDIVANWGTNQGQTNGVLTINYGNNQNVHYNIKANAYYPVVSDVWETAQTVQSFPFTANLNSTNLPLYNNYVLPPASIADGPDVVYKMVFSQDTHIHASVTNGANGKVALYHEDFMNVGGPDLNNNYTWAQDNNDDSEASVLDMAVLPGTYYLAASSTSNTWTVTINTGALPCPETADNPSPATGSTNVDPAGVDLNWSLGNLTTSYKLLFGTNPNNMETLVDWTRELGNHYEVTNLLNSTTYYWQVWERNDGCPDGVPSTLWTFTTHLNAPNNLRAENSTMFNDDVNTLYWDTPDERGLLSYNVYMDDNLIGNTTETSFQISGLSYNMTEGYRFNVTAVYDNGESGYSNDVLIFVTGSVTVEGHVYEQDGSTPIENASIRFNGYDDLGTHKDVTFVTDAEGHFTGELHAGTYSVSASCTYYQSSYLNDFSIAYSETVSVIDFLLNESFNPVRNVVAEYEPDNNPESPYVKVYWSKTAILLQMIEDFETGNFNQFDWQIDGTYPWHITDIEPHSGTYCMKSGNASLNSTTSQMAITMEIPSDCNISFAGKVSSESGYDKGHFYIDGTEQNNWSGETGWFEVSYPVSEGSHVFTWSYTKDNSVSNGDDCFYVDDINFNDIEGTRSFNHYRVYRTSGDNNGPYTEYNTTLLSDFVTDTVFIDNTWQEAESGSYKFGVSCVYSGNRNTNTYIEDFENGFPDKWTTIDADGDGYTWIVDNSVFGHNGSDKVILSKSYDNMHGVLHPDNYLVTPQLSLKGTFSFWACAYDVNYAAEHFGVAVSTTVPETAAFTTIQEWTMTAKGQGTPTPATRSGNRTQGTWYKFSVDLSDYAGQLGYIAIRHFNCSDMYYLLVDDIEYPLQTIQTERESKIVWSNNMDKGMNLTGGLVTLNVSLDSGDSPEGAQVNFTNLNNYDQTHYPINDIILDETGTYTWDSFRKGDYQVTVSKDGYHTMSLQASIWDATTLNYVLHEITQAPNQLYVSSTGWASWNGLGNDLNPLSSPNSFEVDFEDGIPEGWITIDADGDGYNWGLISTFYYGNAGHNSYDGIASQSYSGNSALTPDNWLVSPQVKIKGEITFFAAPYDNTWGAEHFGVFVSTAGNTNPADFTMVWETTLGSKGVQQHAVPRDNGSKVGNWVMYTVDLSAYAGQYGYIAIRHFNCTDQWALFIDDITINASPSHNRHYVNNQVVLTDASNNELYRGNTNNNYFQLPVENLVEGQTYHCKVAGVYSSGLTEWTHADWDYTPCDHYDGADLTVTSTSEGNLLSWSYPETGFGALVYRDNQLLGVSYDVSFLDNGETNSHDYTIRVIHNGNTYDYTYYSMSCLEANQSETTQTITIQSGWTWFSSYINYTATTLDEFKAQIEAMDAFGIIKSQNAYTANDLNGWSGSLTSLDNTQMYMTMMDQELTLTIEGLPVDASLHPITLRPGWTWIAYLNAKPMTLEEAFAGLELSDGDLIKSQRFFSSFNTQEGWTGTLTTLQPGQGYIFLNNSNNIKILFYPNRR